MPSRLSMSFLAATLLFGATGCPAHVVCRSCKVEYGQLTWGVELAEGESLQAMHVTLYNGEHEETIDYTPPRTGWIQPLPDDQLCTVADTGLPPSKAIIQFDIASPTGGVVPGELYDLPLGEPCKPAK